jgi:hypothetical protein
VGSTRHRGRGSGIWRALLVTCAVVIAGALQVQAVSADGDPASDVLVNVDVYLPSAPVAPPLTTLVQRVQLVNRSGYRLKVAVIASKSDLGSIPSLFGHPTDYAKFLGIELSLVYKGNLLIVMPNGFGFYHGGAATTAEQAALDRTPSPAPGAGVVNAAIAGAEALVTAVGPPIAIADTASRGASGVRLSYLLVGVQRAIATHTRVLSHGKLVASAASLLHPVRSPSAHTVSIPLSQRATHLPGLTACVTAKAGTRTSYPSCVPIRAG